MSSHDGASNANSAGKAGATRIAFGDAVVVPSGRIGMASYIDERVIRVQFGQSGPFRLYRPASVRHATLAQVRAAGMYGVGFRIIDEED
jgi:hypothetical protein